MLNICLLSSCVIISQYTQTVVAVQIVYVNSAGAGRNASGVVRNYDFSAATNAVCRPIGLCEHFQHLLVTKFRRTRTTAGNTEAVVAVSLTLDAELRASGASSLSARASGVFRFARNSILSRHHVDCQVH